MQHLQSIKRLCKFEKNTWMLNWKWAGKHGVISFRPGLFITKKSPLSKKIAEHARSKKMSPMNVNLSGKTSQNIQSSYANF